MQIEDSDDDGWFLMQLTQTDLVYLEMGLEYYKKYRKPRHDDLDTYGSMEMERIENMVEQLVDRKLSRGGQLTKEEQERDYSTLIGV